MIDQLPTPSITSNTSSSAGHERLRAAQSAWQRIPLRERLEIIGRIAGSLADQGDRVARAVYRPAATLGEIIASEVLPVAEACRYLHKRAGQLLRPQRLKQRDGAWWMGSVYVTELREALGIVLIIGPSNYPLFLPGVQLIQALAAGNAVIVKPAPSCEEAMHVLIELCIESGVPADLMHQLDSSPESVPLAIETGVDKVLFTGSLSTGKKVARLCSDRMVPMAMELSGNDAVLVADDADLQRVAKCIAYALSLNGGQTCIAPRRLFATADTLQRLIPLLNDQLSSAPERTISQRGWQFARNQLDHALADGATIACGQLSHFEDASRVKPIVIANMRSDMPLTQEDIFAPILSLISVVDMSDALRQADQCRYALGAAIFSNSAELIEQAQSISVGCITINDCLVPTADPRVSFGGRRASGFGMTRGLEGLRELTQLKVICMRRGRWLPHLSTGESKLAPMLQGILKLRHGRSWSERWSGIKSLMKVGKQK